MLRRAIQLALFSTFLSAVLAADPGPSSREQYVLFENGQTLQAICQEQGAYLHLKMGNGASLRVAANQIAFRADTLEQLYAFRRAGVPPRDVAATLALSDWCLRMGLLEQAREQLAVATRLSPSDPRLPNLTRRLTQSSEMKRMGSSARSHQSPRTVVSSQQVSQELASLSAETVQSFTAEIQPLLLNRCGSNGCHGPTAQSSFTLIRTAIGRPIPQRLTQRNLYNVLTFLEGDNVQESRLLNAPASPHGKLQAGFLTSREKRQYLQFVAWCERARQNVPESQPAPEMKAPPVLAQPDPGTASRLDPPSTTTEPKPAIPPATTTPLDPFDPTPFNERFHDPRTSSAGF